MIKEIFQEMKQMEKKHTHTHKNINHDAILYMCAKQNKSQIYFESASSNFEMKMPTHN